MKGKYVAGAILISVGAILTFRGAVEANQGMINAGIGGVFIGIVVLTFSTSDYIKYDAFRAVSLPYAELAKKLVKSLRLKGKAVYLPPYENLPEGGVFLPLHEDFDLDPARLGEDLIFMTDVGREKEMGLLLPSFGKELLGMYESYSEKDFAELEMLNAIESASAVLRSLGLASSVAAEENEKIKIYVSDAKANCSKACEQLPCPICASILLSIAKSLRELIKVDEIRFEGEHVEISARKVGGIERWM
jgi:hypothetical protein